MRFAPRPPHLLAIFAALVLTAGCGSDSADPKAAKQAATKDQTLTLVEQDFDVAKPAGWIIGARGRVVADALELRAGPSEVARSGAETDLSVDDVRVSVLGASRNIKRDDATYGVLCRWVFDAGERSKDYYSFTIAPNGYAAIGTSQEILWQAKEPVASLDTGLGVANEVRAECIGDELSLYVNDELVTTITDDTIERGDVGLVLENYAKKGTATALLDDFSAEQVL